MLVSILYSLSSNALPIIIYLLIIILISFILYFSISEISFNKKIIMFNTMFANFNRKKQLALTGILIRTFMVIYATVYFTSDKMIMYIIIAVLSDLIYVSLNLKKIFFEIPSMIGQIFLIYIIHLMNTYRDQVNDDISVSIIQVLLITFLAVYSLFFLIKDFESIISKKDKEKKYEVKAREN